MAAVAPPFAVKLKPMLVERPTRAQLQHTALSDCAIRCIGTQLPAAAIIFSGEIVPFPTVIEL
jgi:hypothetical protein